MNDDQLTVIIYAILIVIVIPGLYGLVYIENSNSEPVTEIDSLEYVSVEKTGLSEVSITNTLAKSETPSASFTVITVRHEKYRFPDVYTLSGVHSSTLTTSLRSDMSSNITVRSVAPFRKPSFEKKTYKISGENISDRIETKERPFIMTVDTRIDDGGYTESDEFTIQTGNPKYKYNYTVYWEDKSKKTVTGDTTLEFETPGVHQIAIEGDMPHLKYERLYVEKGLGLKIVAIDQWGDIEWRSFEKSFRNTPNMKANYSDTPNLSNVNSIDRMFEGATSFNGSVNNWNTSSVESMKATFAHAKSFNKPIDNWNTENVTTMYSMFQRSNSFNQDISSWDTSSVTNMNSMFLGATSFNQDISMLCVSSISEKPTYFVSDSGLENQTGKLPKWGEKCS